MNNQEPIRFAFFGSSQFSVIVLSELEKNGYLPCVVITTPPKPVGRKLILTPTPVSVWATSRNIPVISNDKLDKIFIYEFMHHSPIISIVASYGKIIPKEILSLPRYKTVNVHPSLLPKYRGATPIQRAILDNEKETGVTIIELDELMDHGPILAQEKVVFDVFPKYEIVEETLAEKGAQILAKILPSWIDGKIIKIEQDHSKATFTKKIKKEDGEVVLTKDELSTGIITGKKALEIFLKLQAYSKWPKVFFRHNDQIIKISEFEYSENKLTILSVIREGKPETQYTDFISSLKNSE